MFFLCIYCEDPTPLVISTIEYKGQVGGENNSRSDVTTFSICPTSRRKFVVKIQDQGTVGRVQ